VQKIQEGRPVEEPARYQIAGQAAPSDLLVIGGGILGLSTACEILARGLSVTVFEEDPKRSATWASAGMLSPYAEHAAAGSLQDMMRAARAAYPAYLQRVEEHSGMRVEMAFPGTLIPSLEDGRQVELEALTAKFIDLGARARYLDAGETAAHEPQLAARGSGAVLLEEEGYVNPRSLHTALRASFDRLGGRWVGLQVLGLVARQGASVGVETTAGVALGRAVINAAGAWADRFLLPEDQARYRVRPIRGQTVRLRPPSRRESIRRVIQVPGYAYLVPRADGTVIVGATSEEVGPFPGVTAEGVQYLLSAVQALVPVSRGWSFLSAGSGLRPMAGDGELFLEPDSQRRGLFHGLGLYRQGILLAPVASTRLAGMALEYLGRKAQ
jgi:glycine oxidase